MSSRGDMLAAVRANKPGQSVPLPDLPSYDAPEHADDLASRFADALAAMGGVWLVPAVAETPAAAMRRSLADRLSDDAVVVSNVAEIAGNRAVTPDTAAATLHDVDIAVVRARFGVAETGSVCFTEAELVINALAYLAQHLVVLLDPGEIVTNIHRAYQRDEYKTAAYAVFHTGPSATADIEGVLVRGAQGVRSLTVIPVQRDT